MEVGRRSRWMVVGVWSEVRPCSFVQWKSSEGQRSGKRETRVWPCGAPLDTRLKNGHDRVGGAVEDGQIATGTQISVLVGSGELGYFGRGFWEAIGTRTPLSQSRWSRIFHFENAFSRGIFNFSLSFVAVLNASNPFLCIVLGQCVANALIRNGLSPLPKQGLKNRSNLLKFDGFGGG
jgi:hypothetical protein